MKFNIIGQAYKHHSQDINNQRCVNMFPMASGPGGRGAGALVPTTGLKLLLNLGNGPVRSLITAGDFTYAVAGNTVYKLTVDVDARTATSEILGTIDSTDGTVSAAASPTQVMWVDGSTDGWIYTIATDTFEQIDDTDADFTGGDQVTFIDSYFVVNKPGTGQFYFSGSNDGLAWDPLSVATAESNPDDVVGLNVSRGELWVFGENTTEIWYNAGNAAPAAPFSNRTGLELQIGCAAKHSIAELEDNLIWLDDRGYIVQASVSSYTRDNNSGYNANVISTEAITSEINSYTNVADAVAMTYNDRGHLMYQISFPANKKTWVYDYTTQLWHERAYYETLQGELQHHFAQYHTKSGTLDIVGGIRDGKLYIMDDIYYDDNGLAIHRITTSPPQYDAEDFDFLEVSSVEIKMETGKALETGDGSDPQVTLRYSHDNGYTWSHHLARDIGQIGKYNNPIRWNRLGTSRDWMFELRIVEPIKFAIIEAAARANIEKGNVQS